MRGVPCKLKDGRIQQLFMLLTNGNTGHFKRGRGCLRDSVIGTKGARKVVISKVCVYRVDCENLEWETQTNKHYLCGRLQGHLN